MKKLSVSDIYGYNYSIVPLNSLRQFWKGQKFFDCTASPKKQNIFLYLDGCSATYSVGQNCFTAKSGSLIYAPVNSKYRVTFGDFEDENSNTVGINFHLYDENGEPFILTDAVMVFENPVFRALVEKIDNADKAAVTCFAKMKSGLYEIISILGEEESNPKGRFDIIKKGIALMNEGSFDMSIAQIATECNVSESYFRKLFKEYSGLSPADYRMNIRQRKAKDYLLHSPLTSGEIAELLCFTDASFFCKQFKRWTGCTPNEYRSKF